MLSLTEWAWALCTSESDLAHCSRCQNVSVHREIEVLLLCLLKELTVSRLNSSTLRRSCAISSEMRRSYMGVAQHLFLHLRCHLLINAAISYCCIFAVFFFFDWRLFSIARVSIILFLKNSRIPCGIAGLLIHIILLEKQLAQNRQSSGSSVWAWVNTFAHRILRHLDPL